MTIVKDVIKKNKPLFLASKKVKNTNKTLTKFFNNTSMARILDIFLDNPDTAISLKDFLRLGISRKSIFNNISSKNVQQLKLKVKKSHFFRFICRSK